MHTLPILQQIALDGIALLFIASGIAKLFDLRAFRQGLLLVPYLPIAWAKVMGFALPPLEIAVAAGLFLNLFAAKMVALALFVAFIAVSLVAISKKVVVPCNCFGSFSQEPFSKKTIRRNVILMCVGCSVISLPARVSGLASVFLAAFVMVAILLFIQIASNRQGIIALNSA